MNKINVKISMEIECPETSYDDLKRLEHHIEEFVDMSSWPEISISNVKVEEPTKIIKLFDTICNKERFR